MKQLFFWLLIPFAAIAQHQDKWEEIYQLEDQGRIQSADEKVALIQKAARKKRDEAEIIRCFFYRARYMHDLEADAQTRILSALDNEIQQLSLPSKALLQLAYAEMLRQHLRSNRWKLPEQRPEGTRPDDWREWTLADFESAIQMRLDASVADRRVLTETKLTSYIKVFDLRPGENADEISLLEYILRQHAEYYREVLPGVNTVSGKPGAQLFASSLEFIGLFSFLPDDPPAWIRLVSTLQEIESLHPSDRNRLERISIMFQKTAQTTRYRSAIRAFKTRDNGIRQEVLLKRFFIRIDTTDVARNREGMALLDSIIAIPEKSNTYWLAVVEKEKMRQHLFGFEAPTITAPDKPFRIRASYQNLSGATVSCYRISNAEWKSFTSEKYKTDSIRRVMIGKRQPVVEKEYEFVKEEADYLPHSTELIVPETGVGCFLVAVRPRGQGDFSTEPKYCVVRATRIFPLYRNTNNSTYLQVLSSKDGNPIKGAFVSYQGNTLVTDADGEVVIPGGQTVFDVVIPGDTLTVKSAYRPFISNYTTESNDDDFDSKAEVYFDRGIYRPGQTVLFKGILVREKGQKAAVVGNTLVNVTVEDPDGKEIYNKDLVTNEFGSFTDKIVVAKGGMTGRYTLTVDEPDDIEKDPQYDQKNDEHPFWDYTDLDYTSFNFRVEEYKRPKFELLLDPFREILKPGDSATVTGKLRAFDGSAMPGARVNYVVRYSTQLDKPQPKEADLVGRDFVTTDAKGGFSIRFKTRDSIANVRRDQTVIYYLRAEATDLTGESHDASAYLNASARTRRITMKVPGDWDTTAPLQASVFTSNLNGRPMKTEGTLRVYLQKRPTDAFKTRPFAKTDRPIVPQDEYNRLFPDEKEAGSEDFPWLRYRNFNAIPEENGELIFSKEVSTSNLGVLDLSFLPSYPSGDYRICFETKEEAGYVELGSADIHVLNHADPYHKGQLLTVRTTNLHADSEGFAAVQITSPVPNLYVRIVGFYDGRMFSQKDIRIRDGKGTARISIPSQLKERIMLLCETVYDGQRYTEVMEVPLHSNKETIALETESFRSLIPPGSSQNWTFRVPGSGVEALASMYDSSLDQFARSYWKEPSFQSYVDSNEPERGTLSNTMQNFTFNALNAPLSQPIYRNESTRFLWFGFDFSGNKGFNNTLYKQLLARKAPLPADAILRVGIVTDSEGLPLPGVSVKVDGTARGTQTDLDGMYQISVALGEQLTFSFLGMEPQTHKVTSSECNVTLKENPNQLQEVVVEGYNITGSQTKSNVAAATTQYLNESTEDFVYKLQSQVAGLNVAYGGAGRVLLRGVASISTDNSPLYVVDGVPISAEQFVALDATSISSVEVLKDAAATAKYGNRAANGVVVISTKAAVEALKKVIPRKNFSETAFFFPFLRPDDDGRIEVSFEAPEATTEWKFRLLAHNKKAVSTITESTVTTQKELMITPNFPRFVRENDRLVVKARIANLSPERKKGTAGLTITDAAESKPYDNEAGLGDGIRAFDVPPMGTTTVMWELTIPEGLAGLRYTVVAKSGENSDGEENLIPVLKNAILMTDTQPLWVREGKTQHVHLATLATPSVSAKPHLLTVEYTANPAWSALQSLPYLMEFEHECAEQTFSRYYANQLAAHIVASNPKIADVFNSWAMADSTQTLNEDLRALLAEETPWMDDLQTDSARKRHLAACFDPSKTAAESARLVAIIAQRQSASGGFPWFEGGKDSGFITQHILCGFGHLAKLGAVDLSTPAVRDIVTKGVAFLDALHDQNAKQSRNSDGYFRPFDLHYLYTRSFFTSLGNNALTKRKTEWQTSIKNEWKEYRLYEKALAALVLYRYGDKDGARMILQSVKETAVRDQEKGMFWNTNKPGWYWYQAPIETQALLIEAFSEITDDKESIDAMKVWLVSNRQRSNWPTTKATTEAIYALLTQGSDWLDVRGKTDFKIGSERLPGRKLAETEKEAQTGYVKLQWKTDEIKPGMAEIDITNRSQVPGYGGVFLQYFERIDAGKEVSTSGLAVSKQLFIKPLSGEPVPLTANTKPRLGDRVVVRLTLSAQDDYEFVHLKDLRASCFEPVDVLSGYEYRQGIGFYKTTRDAATHYFFERLPKGVYVLEYEVKVNNAGDFSAGIATIESMYAPAFSGRSSGGRIETKE